MTTQKAVRRELPETLRARSHAFTIAGHEGVIVVSMYGDGTPGRIMITMFRDGATLQGLLHGLGVTLSLALQYGVPIHDIMIQFKGLAFGPSGWTKHPKIVMANSVLDYLAQWLELEFPELMPLKATREGVQPAHQEVRIATNDCPPCDNCGSLMVRGDNIWRCANCGVTAGLG